jgi:hypothetical protein
VGVVVSGEVVRWCSRAGNGRLSDPLPNARYSLRQLCRVWFGHPAVL